MGAGSLFGMRSQEAGEREHTTDEDKVVAMSNGRSHPRILEENVDASHYCPNRGLELV